MINIKINDKLLSMPCRKVKEDELEHALQLGQAMLDYLKKDTSSGIGLAANQIGFNRRMFVMDVSNERDNPQVFINPIVKSKNNIKMPDTEGCLSCPGEEVKVNRSMSINLEWTCRHGKKQHKTFFYLQYRVVQHEMDHLNGKLIID